MKFEEMLSEIANDIPVPDELLPQNIAVMLKEKGRQPETDTNIKSEKNIRVSAQKRTIMIRTTAAAAAAACAVFAAGMLAYSGGTGEPEQLEAPIPYEGISPDSYDELYSIYTGITLNGENGGNDSDKTIAETGIPIPDVDDRSAYDFSAVSGADVSDADIIKSDGEYLYCLKDSTLYIISLETMEVVSQVKCTLDPPVEIYTSGGKLIMISRETEEIQITDSGNDEAVTEASDAENSAAESDVPAKDEDTHQSAELNSDTPEENAPTDKTVLSDGSGKSAIPAARANAAVDIFDVTDPANPVRTASYKQNGSYVSSEIADGVLYMATAYSDYRVKPLDTQANLEDFVPAYCFNGEKTFIAAENIIVPGGASSTDYTVISAMKLNGGEMPEVKAVLGSNKNVYCSADTLYVVSTGKKGREYSVVSSFDLSGGGIKYRSSGSVEGTPLGQQSMNEYDGMFRIAAEIKGKDGRTSISVYVLDKSLTVINSAGQLFPDGKASAVRFEGNYARIISEENGDAVITLDLSSNPPALAQSMMANEAFLFGYSEEEILGVGKTRGSGLTLTMYDAATGMAKNAAVFADEEATSPALRDRRALLIDRENDFIGVPVCGSTDFGTKNSYCVYGYDGAEGFVKKGVIEYVDPDDGMAFRRAVIIGDTLYITGCGRVISARVSDLKIINVLEY